MTRFILALTLGFASLNAKALEGLTSLESKLLEKNQDVLSLQKQIESKKALKKSSSSAFYPTLNAIGGLGQNKTDDLPEAEKGTLVYLEGKLNLFNGFKDLTIRNHTEIDIKIAILELESKKRELRLQLTELASDMIRFHKVHDILTEEFQITQTQKKMAAKKVNAGLTGTIDNLEFELREDEIKIEQNQIQKKHEEAHQKLVELFGEDILDQDLAKVYFSQASILATAIAPIRIENTLGYQKTEMEKAKHELEKQEIRSELLPTLEFTYSLGRITPSEETSFKFSESKYALLLTVPLFSGFDSFYKIKAANFKINSADKLRRQTAIIIGSEFQILKTKMSELNSLFQIHERKLLNSQKYFNLTLAEYKRGVKNSPDLVGATERLYSTKKKKYEILSDMEILKAKLNNFK